MAMAAAGLTGCENAKARKKQAAEALEQKYHEKFEVTDYRNAGFMADYYTVQATQMNTRIFCLKLLWI